MNSCRPPEHSSNTQPAEQNGKRSALFDYIRYPACKRLINRIHIAQKEKGIKSITALSQFPGEGKTAFISVIAIGFMALLNKRVLIMDTVSQTRDESFYYRGLLGNPLNTSNGAADRPACIDLITTKNLSRQKLLNPHNGSGLMLIPEVPAVSAELGGFDSADFQVPAFIESMKGSYDLILLDTCALSRADKDTFDPLILAQHTDTSILVTSPATLEHKLLSSLVVELKRNRISPLGIVLDSGVIEC